MNPIINGKPLILDCSAKTFGANRTICLYRNNERLTDAKMKKYGIKIVGFPINGKQWLFVSDNENYEYRKVKD